MGENGGGVQGFAGTRVIADPHDSSGTDGLRVLVLQVGARLHYGVPAVYARAGVLEALYTDACASVGALSVARRLLPERLRPAAFKRLLGRTLPPDIAPGRVRVATLSTLAERIARRAFKAHEGLTATHALLAKSVRRHGFERANALYSVSNADLPLLREAKARGLTIIYEQIINPSVGLILREERERFPGLEAQDPEREVRDGIARDRDVFALADSVVCASAFVRSDIHQLAGEQVKVEVIPYGIEESWLDRASEPERGRVLFVGSVGLRKGNHYLAEAQRLLRARGRNYDFRVVGPHDGSLVKHPRFRGPLYLGQVPRTEIGREFARADVFVLPTLAESFALVHLEALAHGVPVVTTPNCGSVVEEGKQGFIVPIRDPFALADAIERIVEDRALRDRLSAGARIRAAQFTWSAYGAALLAATRTAVTSARR